MHHNRASHGLPYEKRADGKGETKRIENSPLFMLPEGWVWARLRSLSAQINYGVSNSAERSGSHKLLRITDIDQQKVDWNSVPYTAVDEATATNCRVSDGDILFARIGATVGKTYLATGTPRNTVYASYLIRVQALLCDAHYLINFFDTPYYWEEISSNAVGSGRPNVNGTVLSGLFVPVPPLAEQHRIVGALGKYLALVDEIERDQADLGGLFAQLRSKVLDLAVRGELVERDPGDEPASELLARIREEKLAMVGRGELKPKDVKNDTVIFAGSDGLRYEKPADGKGKAKCIEGEIPFEIPEGWSWARLNNIVQLTSGVDLIKTEYNADHKGIPYITGASNFENGYLIENRWTETPKRISNKGELLFTCKGTVGEMAINRFEAAHIARQVMSIKPNRELFLPYLEMTLSWYVESIKSRAKGFIPGIERTTLLSILVPVPPLAEQRHIIETIKEASDLLN